MPRSRAWARPQRRARARELPRASRPTRELWLPPWLVMPARRFDGASGCGDRGRGLFYLSLSGTRGIQGDILADIFMMCEAGFGGVDGVGCRLSEVGAAGSGVRGVCRRLHARLCRSCPSASFFCLLLLPLSPLLIAEQSAHEPFPRDGAGGHGGEPVARRLLRVLEHPALGDQEVRNLSRLAPSNGPWRVVRGHALHGKEGGG